MALMGTALGRRLVYVFARVTQLCGPEQEETHLRDSTLQFLTIWSSLVGPRHNPGKAQSWTQQLEHSPA